MRDGAFRVDLKPTDTDPFEGCYLYGSKGALRLCLPILK